MSREVLEYAMKWAAGSGLPLGSEELTDGLKDRLNAVVVDGETYRRAKEWTLVPDYFLSAVYEFLQDWEKGDFDLPKLAASDASSILAASKHWAAELRQYPPAVGSEL